MFLFVVLFFQVIKFRYSKYILLPLLSAARLETFMFENVPVDRIGLTNTRLSNLEYLGQDMIETGNEFGTATPYGQSNLKIHRFF